MKYNLFLDDERQIYDVKWVRLPMDHPWIVVKNFGEFVDTVLKLGLPEFVSFDHDLADFHYKIGFMENEHLGKNLSYGSEKTGMDAVKWLVDYCMIHKLKFPNYAIHSLNVVGYDRMAAYIDQIGRAHA